jgi:hypothetical protein
MRDNVYDYFNAHVMYELLGMQTCFLFLPRARSEPLHVQKLESCHTTDHHLQVSHQPHATVNWDADRDDSTYFKNVASRTLSADDAVNKPAKLLALRSQAADAQSSFLPYMPTLSSCKSSDIDT